MVSSVFLGSAFTGPFPGLEIVAWLTPVLAASALALGVVALRRVHKAGTFSEQLALWNLLVVLLFSGLVSYGVVGELVDRF